MINFSLCTDHYEFTMLNTLIEANKAQQPAVFEVFARKLPSHRSFGVFAGSNSLLAALQDFYFDADSLRYLRKKNIIGSQTQTYLEKFRFNGSISAYREGELFFPYSPVLTIQGSLGECLLLETLVLSLLNHESAVASVGARITSAAHGAMVMEAGSRRIGPESAIRAARAAYLSGIDVTSNLAAGLRYGIPTIGTASHALTMAYPNEIDAFYDQAQFLGSDSVFLVDTFDINQGIYHAVKASDKKLKGIRIDSGDLLASSQMARDLLDELGAPQAQIMVSGDLNEHAILNLVQNKAPIDAFESGHHLVTGSGAPSAGFVYKLVAIGDASKGAQRHVAKKSHGKQSMGGHKFAYRQFNQAQQATAELLYHAPLTLPTPHLKTLQVPLLKQGQPCVQPTLVQARAHCQKALSTVPLWETQNDPAIKTNFL